MSSNALPQVTDINKALTEKVNALSKELNKYKLELEVKKLELSQAQTQIKTLTITVAKLRQEIELQRHGQKPWPTLHHHIDIDSCEHKKPAVIGSTNNGVEYDEDNQIIYTDTSDLLSCNDTSNAASVMANISNYMLPPHQKHTPERLDVVRHFNNNRIAYDMWTRGCEDTVVLLESTVTYDRLYSYLCQYFIQRTGCSRVPKKKDLQAFIVKFVESPKSFDGRLRYAEFLKFWRWFLQCIEIMDEIAYLWDFQDGQISFLCNVFMGRKEVESLLREHEQGTFILRLASVGGIALSYFEMNRLKHSSLTRKGRGKYEVKRREKQGANSEIDSISNIILSYDKIKKLYTPHRSYPKNNVFF